MTVDSAEICLLNLTKNELQNITFKECIFDIVAFEDCKITKESKCFISKSSIDMASGLASPTNVPGWVQDCMIAHTEILSNSSRIKSSSLLPAQKLFLSIIQKIFFQVGGGRKESTLYKGGFGQQYDRKLIDEILKILVTRGFVEKSKDSAGYIYNPKREHTAKMKAIKDELTLSQDELWLEIAKLN